MLVLSNSSVILDVVQKTVGLLSINYILDSGIYAWLASSLLILCMVVLKYKHTVLRKELFLRELYCQQLQQIITEIVPNQVNLLKVDAKTKQIELCYQNLSAAK